MQQYKYKNALITHTVAILKVAIKQASLWSESIALPPPRFFLRIHFRSVSCPLWKQKEEGYKFLDSDSDLAFHTAGPSLMHFRNTILPTVYNQSAQVWNAIVSSNTTLPTPSIRLYDDDGNYVGTRVYQENPMVPHQQPSTP